MNSQFAKIRWGKLLLVSILIMIVDFGLITIVIGVHAFMLGVQARGAPDPVQIQQFARQVGAFWGPIVTAIATVVGAGWITRKMQEKQALHGALIGVIITIIGFLASRRLSWRSIVFSLLTIIAGWLGGTFSSWRTRRRIS